VTGAAVLGLLLPVTLVALFHASVTLLAYGAAMWTLGQAVKIVAHLAAAAALGRKVPPAGWAALSGVLSAVSELACAAVFLILFFPSISAGSLIGFGVGASSMEIVYLLAARVRRLALRRRTPNSTRAPATIRSPWIPYAFVIERLTALLMHVGSRCLAYVSLSEHLPWAGVWAVTSFALVDGLAMYGRVRRWNWYDPHTCRRFYGFVLAAGVSDLAVFAAIAQGWSGSWR